MSSDRSHIAPRLPVLGLLALALAGTACSSSEADAGGAPAADATPQPMATRPRVSLDLCALMPVGEVAAILQANGVAPVTKERREVGGSCSYQSEPGPGGVRTQLLIDFTSMRSVEMAQGTIEMHRKDYIPRGVALTEVPGLGDEAFAPARPMGASVKLRVREYFGQVNLNVGEQRQPELQPAVLALAREVVERLPR